MTGSSRGDAGGLDVGTVTLQEFTSHMRELLATFGTSAAACGEFRRLPVPPGAYGTGFAAAQELAAQYERARIRLEEHLGMLSRHIEWLGAVVHRAGQDYDRAEWETVACFAAVGAGTGPAVGPGAGRHATSVTG